MADENCLFCKIHRGKIPATVVHQDDSCVVIRDINPQAPMHVLGDPGATTLNHSTMLRRETRGAGHFACGWERALRTT
jgi:histidine triad (HIT) family protein